MSDEDSPKRGKLIIEFDPEFGREVDEVIATLTNGKWKHIVWEFDQHLRSLIKHGLDEESLETYYTVEALREKLWSFISDNDLTLD